MITKWFFPVLSIVISLAIGIYMIPDGNSSKSATCNLGENIPVASVSILISNPDPWTTRGSIDDFVGYEIDLGDRSDFKCGDEKVTKILVPHSFPGANHLLYPIKYPNKQYLIDELGVRTYNGKTFVADKSVLLSIQ